ncbi:MAG: TetR/AcrR family transcriptional regulator [Labilithrix sp.]|nr:TetR/AcrR family transcriptional regulator [Labilithrix sp.]
MRRQPRAAYHHGDLRQACIAAGLALLSKQGKDAVSLREVARKCRVSPRAPYQHFADKTEFFAALAEEGFKEFGAALAQAKDGLVGLARAYLDFATRRPALMQLMFGDDFEERATRNPALHQAALATFQQLEEQVARLHEGAGGLPCRLLAVNAWALVHGLSELLRHGQLAHVLGDDANVSTVLEVAVQLFVPSRRGPNKLRRMNKA